MEINAEARAILEHNDDVRARIECLQKEIEELRATIKPPCAHCPLDGMYRCESCGESCYEGAFDRDYMNLKSSEEGYTPVWKRS